MSVRRPAFVKLHPADTCAGLPRVFLEQHPDSFEPQTNPYTGFKEKWGFSEDDDGEPMAFMMRSMTCQSMYGPHSSQGLKKPGKPPEQQFVDVLIAKKVRALEAGKEAAEPFYRRDFILDIDLACPDPQFRHEPRVWRRVRVSGGTQLTALQDKVITPVMGWVRNYHGHLWTDYRDGALLGDPASQAIDMMHVSLHYHGFVDERPWRLADILREVGQQMSYTYDIGDNWRHVITVVEVLPEEESTGRAAVLDGAMACPPEDSSGMEGSGSGSYQEFLDQMLDPAYQRTAEYRTRMHKARRGFQPQRFVLAEAQAALEAALASRASVSSGSKQFVTPLGMWGDGRHGAGVDGLIGGALGRGQQLRQQAEPTGSILTETVATCKDPRGVAVCANCGNPNNLMSCGGCKLLRFCGRQCQLQAWPRHKQDCKAEQKRRAEKAAKTGAASSS
ncbi:hypothetical protein CHLNCDRAFT_136514 [Chlorella variabilis]|uniref:MYND-type domain-containing protein n=1 Tax=Chlorella variabilis TaxID=554065 RepID=E1ZKI0_CHLVA|nr:hypothetical protein CHLNCDRAFT_136514 [Chlorella variabilis]EFN53808.1 hypothetical protein CHLNCDRAFT_136514 [Chlorella variabilis]|eukprot:XP_005845910.1 hypothetical protein CHLNCDRAFT_136514 [Chlorella variabilis]